MITRSIRRNKTRNNSNMTPLSKRLQNLSQGMSRNFKNMYGLPFLKALKLIQINLNIYISKLNIHRVQLRLISLLVKTISKAQQCSFQENETGLEFPEMIDINNKIHLNLMKCNENHKFQNDKHSSWSKSSKMHRQRLEIWTVSSKKHGRSLKMLVKRNDQRRGS